MATNKEILRRGTSNNKEANMEKKKTWKLLWLAILLALMVGIISGISVYWWQKSSFEKGKSQYEAELEKATQTIQELESRIAQLEPEREEGAATPATPTTTSTAEATEPKITKECGIVKKVYTSGGKNYLDIDYVQLFFGDEAYKAACEDGEIGPAEDVVPNDYYIRNVNPKIRTFEIHKEADIIVEWPYGSGPRSLDFTTFKEAFGAGALYWITLKDSIVIRIEEQFVP